MADKPTQIFDLAGKKVWVAGHRGMVGSAICRRLERENCQVLTVTRSEVDLTRQADVEAWMSDNQPQVIFMAAATVGGILANDSRPAEFIYDNLAIATNVIHGAWKTGVEKLLFLGSSCLYPKHAPQPMTEDALLSGPLEPTNEWYAIAKIAGIKMCQAYRKQYGCDFISAQPTSLYGPGDNFDLQSSHVIPALVVKTHQAKMADSQELEVWGTGNPKREFLYIDDLADALVFQVKCYSDESHINIGTGRDLTIRELAQTVVQTVGFAGALNFNTNMPDGTPRKLLDVSRIKGMGWTARVDLAEGLRRTYDWYLTNVAVESG
jgi:GDP-L-fucose synthase